MKVYTEIVISMVTGEVVKEEFFDYQGPVALCKGASDDQRSLGQQQMALYNEVANNYSQVFQNSKSIMDSLKSVWQPVIDKGIDQYGYSLPEDSALRSVATSSVGQQYKNAAAAVGERQAAAGGGNVALPSGTANKENRALATSAANEEANLQTGITKAGYEQGRQNFLNASKIMSSAPGELFNPATASAEAATGAGNAASKTESEISQEDAAASPWAAIGGLLGGAASAFTGGLGAAAGKAMLTPKPS